MKLYAECPGRFRSGVSLTLDLTRHGRRGLLTDYRELRRCGLTPYHARGVLFRQAHRVGGPNAVLLTRKVPS